MVVQPPGITSRVIRYGESLYVQHMNGAYISNSILNSSRFTAQMPPPEESSESPANVKKSQPVQIQLLGKTDGEIEDGAVVSIQSTEAQLGDRTVLELSTDKRRCEYQRKQPNDRKQAWVIHKRHQTDDKYIRYGDEVYFQSVFAKHHWLSRSSDSTDVSVFRDANEWWTLQTESQTNLTLSSETQFLQSQFDPQARGFSAGNMAYLAYCAQAAYSSKIKSKTELKKLGFSIEDDQHFLDFPDDTQAIVIGDADKIIVVFRGTENSEDWRTNIKLRKVDGPEGQVHRGFKTSLDDAWPTILKRITALRTNNQPIWFTGHSLGGALATMACATLKQDDAHNYEIAGVYTFGQPRVGDAAFAKWLSNSMKGRFFRLVNNNDMVARIPRIRYQHVGQLLYFDASGNLHNNMVLSWLSFSAIRHRFQGYFGSFLDQDLDSLRDHNMGTYRLLTMRQLKA